MGFGGWVWIGQGLRQHRSVPRHKEGSMRGHLRSFFLRNLRSFLSHHFDTFLVEPWFINLGEKLLLGTIKLGET